MKAIVECKKGTREKYEHIGDDKFVLDRVLKKKWLANYGYILDTLQADGDGLDCYIIGNEAYGDRVDVFPVCLVYCIDSGKVDNKLICASKTAKRFVMSTARRLIHFMERQKNRQCFVAGVTWNDRNIQFELAKCRAYYNLFVGGK